MFTQGFGEVITDILTINPSLSAIPSASAILDTSNYTFNAITLGKDAHGYKFHGHTVSSNSGGVYNNNFLQFTVYNTVSPSSYHSSATHRQFSSTYSSVPCYPSIYDRRLERGSTVTNVTSHNGYTVSDLGHYLNVAIDSNLSSIWNVIGGFPPSGLTGKYLMLSSNNQFITSGYLSGVFNSYGLVDKNGFIKISSVNASSIAGWGFASGGPKLLCDIATFSANPTLSISTYLVSGDSASLAAFGGINHIGLWCLDIKAMLTEGLTPPYVWNYLNNNRKYKLVAKATLWEDILWHNDATETLSKFVYDTNSKHYSGFISTRVGGFTGLALDGFVGGSGYTLKINFK